MISTLFTLILYPLWGTFCHAPVGTGRYVRWLQSHLTFPAGDEDSETPNKGSDHPYPSYLNLLFCVVYTRVFKLSCA